MSGYVGSSGVCDVVMLMQVWVLAVLAVVMVM